MKLNDRLLALLRDTKTRPLAASEIARKLALAKRERKALATAIQRLLNAGKLHRSRTGLISLPAAKPKRGTALSPYPQTRRPLNLRRIFTPRTHSTLASNAPQSPDRELRQLLETYKLSPSFSPETEAAAAALPAQIHPADHPHRRDYRSIPTLTIDPDDAKDFDDALSIEPLPGNRTRIGIHIADVAAYVRPDTLLDREAQRRGNSTYLVGTVIPMLPRALSNGLCSLVEGADRLCQAVLLTFGAHGTIIETDFTATLIRSRKRLTYKQAHTLLFTDTPAEIRLRAPALAPLPDTELAALQTWLRQLWQIAATLRSDRMAHGSLDLDMPETKIILDAHGHADRLERVDNDESHQLIEEFMLAANQAIAQLTRRARLPSLYRVHDDPEPERLAELRQELAAHGLPATNLTHRAELTRILTRLDTHPQGHHLRSLLLRSLKKACYRPTPDGHYGLNKRDYTHFTSPIRRYADLLVHRSLASYLATQNNTAPAPSAKPKKCLNPRILTALAQLAEHLSQTELNSQAAERESVKLKRLEYFERELKKTPPTHFAAIITELRPHGLFIELTESLTYGFIPRSPFGKQRKALNRLRPGTSLDVTVYKVDRPRRTIDFRPAL